MFCHRGKPKARLLIRTGLSHGGISDHPPYSIAIVACCRFVNVTFAIHAPQGGA